MYVPCIMNFAVYKLYVLFRHRYLANSEVFLLGGILSYYIFYVIFDWFLVLNVVRLDRGLASRINMNIICGFAFTLYCINLNLCSLSLINSPVCNVATMCVCTCVCMYVCMCSLQFPPIKFL